MYLTTYRSTTPVNTNVSYTDLLTANLNLENYTPEHYKQTFYIENPKPITELSHQQQTQVAVAQTGIYMAKVMLNEFEENYESQYTEFPIPKRSGGLRMISAPNEKFKTALKTVQNIFKTHIRCLPHNAAYAYVENTDYKDALIKHQQNNSKWFLKIDLSDFFPSCTEEFIFNQLKELYPFYYFDDEALQDLKKVIKICCLHGSLPQGSPMSPLLTNLAMVSYDYNLKQYLKRGTGEHFCYTRYADDILISSKSNFNFQELIEYLKIILTPFQIKDKKTRYGNIAGSNWNLGLMLNKDNNITLGYEKKKTLNAMLNNFLRDFKTNIKWPRQDVYILQGQLGQLKHIEPDYYDHIIRKYENKYQIDYKRAISISLKIN